MSRGEGVGGGKGLLLESHHEAACETYLHGAEGVGLRVRRPQFTSWLLCLGKSLNFWGLVSSSVIRARYMTGLEAEQQ